MGFVGYPVLVSWKTHFFPSLAQVMTYDYPSKLILPQHSTFDPMLGCMRFTWQAAWELIFWEIKGGVRGNSAAMACLWF